MNQRNLRPRAIRELGLILVSFLLLAWAYGGVMPPFENLDEIEHFSAIRYVADSGSLPVHDEALQEQYLYRQEASQPPLYYILMASVTRLLGLSGDDTNAYAKQNPFVACGPSDQRYNKHVLYHNPSQEAFPWQGALLTLRVLRALGPLLQMVTVAGGYGIARLALPHQRPVAPLAAALVAFNPQFLSVASGVNNDNLVTPLATVALYLALVTHQQGPTLRRSLALGVVIGLAALSKLSGLALIGLVGLILLRVAYRWYHSARRSTRQGWTAVSQTLSHGILIGVVTLAICGWWFWRNWRSYGDPTALKPMLEIVGRQTSPSSPLSKFGLMFRSYWGQIACSFFRPWFYVFFGSLSALGLVGLAWGTLRRKPTPEDGEAHRQSRWGMFFLATWFAIVVAAWIRWDRLTPAPGGRLLFPAITSVAILLAYGLLSLCPPAWRPRASRWGILLLAVVALITLRWELYLFFAPPRTYAEDHVPPIAHSLEASFGSQIGLRGYDAEVTGDAPPYLDVTLYWQALAPLSRDYALAIQLTSPIPGDDSLRFNYNTWPGRGNYPTTAWQPGQVIADHYRFRLPPSDLPTQAWHLLTAFYDRESDERLAVQLNDQDVGGGLALTTLRVPGRRPVCPNEHGWEEPVNFGGIISLTGATVHPLESEDAARAASGIPVSLCWVCLAPPPADYTVFVHLYDENDQLTATGDGPPMNGAFPTRLWQPGDVVADRHFITIEGAHLQALSENQAYRIGVGIYDPVTGARLDAARPGQPTTSSVVFLP